MNSPTQRTLKLFRDAGWTCSVVEKFNRFARVRQDVFGFGDILAFAIPKPLLETETKYGNLGHGIALIQATSDTNISSRMKKVKENQATRGWLSSGGRIFVVGWGKRGARGKKKLWQPFISEVSEGSL